MQTKPREKGDWTCKLCKRENLENLYFVCPDCMEKLGETHIYKGKEKGNGRR